MRYHKCLVNLLFLTVMVAAIKPITEERMPEQLEERVPEQRSPSKTEQRQQPHTASITLSGFDVLDDDTLNLVPGTSSTLNFDISLKPQLHNRDLGVFYIGIVVGLADTYRGAISLRATDLSQQSLELQAFDGSFGDYYANTKMVPAIASEELSKIFNIPSKQPGVRFHQMMLPSFLYCQQPIGLHPRSGGAKAGNELYYGDQVSVRCNFQFQVDAKSSDNVIKLYIAARLWDAPVYGDRQ